MQKLTEALIDLTPAGIALDFAKAFFNALKTGLELQNLINPPPSPNDVGDSGGGGGSGGFGTTVPQSSQSIPPPVLAPGVTTHWNGFAWVPDIPGNALGTNFWKGGLTWVGERGPELVNLPNGSRIFNNEESGIIANAGRAAMGAGIALQNFIEKITDSTKMAVYRSTFSGSGGMMTSYQTINSPVTIGPIYVDSNVEGAEFVYRVQQVVNNMRNI
jgi:hypothetical protein